MTLNELQSMVREGEHQYLEFKSKVNHPEKIIREMSAFANTGGGRLIVGVEDNGQISGLKHPDEDLFQLEQTLTQLCRPRLNFQLEVVQVSRKRKVLVYTISSSRKKPHYINENQGQKGTVYYRVSDRSIQASRELVEILKRQKRNKGVTIRYEDHEKKLLEYLDKHEKITLQKFMEISGLSRYHASRKLVLLVLARVIRINPREREDFFVLDQAEAEPRRMYFHENLITR